MGKWENSNTRLCNCRIKKSCPLNGKYLKACTTYKIEISTEEKCTIYHEIVDSDFKSRYNNHTMSICHKCHINETELSMYLWHRLSENIRFDLHWSVAAHASPYKCGTCICGFCLTAK